MSNYTIIRNNNSKVVTGFELIILSRQIIEENSKKDFLYKYNYKKKSITTNDEAIHFLEKEGYTILKGGKLDRPYG